MSIADGFAAIHKCTIERAAKTKGLSAATERTWKAVAIDVPCFVQEGDPIESMLGNQKGQRSEATVWFHSDPLMNEDKRIIFNGVVYDFVAANNMQNLNRLWGVSCTRYTSQGQQEADNTKTVVLP